MVRGDKLDRFQELIERAKNALYKADEFQDDENLFTFWLSAATGFANKAQAVLNEF